MNIIRQFPHCDQRVLHAPGECQFCDAHPEWQELRQAWQIAFTGKDFMVIGPQNVVTTSEAVLPCPADFMRGQGHMKWGGNVARPLAKPAKKKRVTINWVVAGQRLPMNVEDETMTLRHAANAALAALGYRISSWEIRDAGGYLLDGTLSIAKNDVLDTDTLYLNPPAGFGG